MTDSPPHDYKYKMVNGELVELTPEEIAELHARDAAAAKPEPIMPGEGEATP